jgi:nicotinamidase-related amidase
MLVIVDMQEDYSNYFRPSKKRNMKVLRNIQQRIIFARQHREIIINLLYNLEGPTLYQIKKMLKGYPNKVSLTKNQFDGSSPIIRYIKKRKLSPQKIDLCGVFEDVCVLETWRSLKEKGYPVSVVNKDLTFPTDNNWRGVEKYPIGFLGG